MTGLWRVDLQPKDKLVRGTRGSKPRPGRPEWSGSASRCAHRLAPVARGERPRSYRDLAIAGKGVQPDRDDSSAQDLDPRQRGAGGGERHPRPDAELRRVDVTRFALGAL